MDSWVIQREHEDPAQYAETWARDGGVTGRDARWPELQNAWLDDFATRDVESIGFGYLLLRRPEAGSPSRPGVLRTEQATGTGTGSLAAHLAQSLRALDTLSHLDDDALAATRLVRADGCRRAPAPHPRGMGPDAHRARAGSRVGHRGPRRPASRRDRRRPGWDSHPRPGARRRVRPHRCGPRRRHGTRCSRSCATSSAPGWCRVETRRTNAPGPLPRRMTGPHPRRTTP